MVEQREHAAREGGADDRHAEQREQRHSPLRRPAQPVQAAAHGRHDHAREAAQGDGAHDHVQEGGGDPTENAVITAM